MIESMQKVEIVGKRRFLDDTLQALQQFGKLHLVEIHQEGLDPVQLTSEEQDLLTRMRLVDRMLTELARDFALPSSAGTLEGNPATWMGKLESVTRELESHLQQIQKLENEAQTLEDYARAIRSLAQLLERHGEERALPFTLAKNERRVLSALSREIEQRWNVEPAVYTVDLRGERLLVVFSVPRDVAEAVAEYLRKEGLAELRLPLEVAGDSLLDAARALDARLEAIPHERERAETAVRGLIEKHRDLLARGWQSVKDAIVYYESKERFPRLTRLTFVLHGWIPARAFNELASLLSSRFGRSVVVRERDPKPPEYHRVPVVLKGPSLAQPFRTFLRLYSLPVYGTIDPSGFLFVFLPVFFGFMLGDAGYGLLGTLLFSFLYFKAKNQTLKDISVLYLWAMFWSILFGILFGEVFGDLGTRFGMKPILMHRVKEVGPLLVIAIAFGTVQVLLGILLGVINQLRLRHKHHAYAEIFRMIGLVGLVLMAVIPISSVIVGKAVPFWPLFWPGVGLLVLASIGVAKLHGFVAPLEILSAMGNIFSYARLMAVGLASAILGEVANLLSGMVKFALFVLIVGVLFHTMNTVLGLFDPTIQGFRLQLVEFFSKFYLGNGVPYTPFKKGGSYVD